MKRLWLGIQVGRTLVGVWPFACRVETYRQHDAVVMVGIGWSGRP